MKQSTIDRNYRKSKHEVAMEVQFCESCGRTDRPLSISHIISRARCKQIGKPELIYDPGNLVVECYEAPTSYPKACHNIWETGTMAQRENLTTYERKKEYIRRHDPQMYTKMFEINFFT